MRLASGYHIEETISNKVGRSIISADIAGDDFDIAVNSATRVRTIRGKSWASEDDGHTWHRTATPDTALFYFLTAPLGSLPAQFVVQQTNAEGDHAVSLLVVKAEPPPAPEMIVRFWVAQAVQGKTWIERFSGPEMFMGAAVHVDARYTRVDDVSQIEVPSTN